MFLFGFFILSLFPFSAFAQEVLVDDAALDENVTAVYGTACENIRAGEAKSSARVRVTDKASFLAVQKINGLEEFKKEVNDHDFNVMVYNLVDNYLEDMAVRTTSQNDEKICVEVTGYIQKNNIVKSINETLQQSAAPDEEQEFETNPELEEIMTAATEKSKPETTQETADVRKIYLAPVQFYNDSQSEAYHPLFEEIFADTGLAFAAEEKNADYVIRPKVLRAKVDPINKDTSRLQMVVSMELESKENGQTTTSHQNRFVLFTADSGEQEAARKLLSKLFSKAGDELKEKISQNEQKQLPGLPPVITPASR